MSDDRRRFIEGGTFAFTVVTYQRQRLFDHDNARRLLHEAFDYARETQPFELDAIVLLPDHLHALMTLPPGDADYATRWSRIKRRFTITWQQAGGQPRTISEGKRNDRRQGVWQPRYWEHAIRDEDDYTSHLDYIHYNPVKHSLVRCPHEWPYSSFHRYVATGVYDQHWCCQGQAMAAFKERMTRLSKNMGE